MGHPNYLMPVNQAPLDLSCFGVSCGASLVICRKGEWVCEIVPGEGTILVDGVCPTTTDFNKHDLPLVCPADVADKCGCLGSTAGGGSGGDGGAGEETPLTEAQLQQVADCINEFAAGQAAAKADE